MNDQQRAAMQMADEDAEKIYRCPECNSDQVTTEHHQMFMLNTGEPYCHSMKPHDLNSPATCLDCWWLGELKNLTAEVVA